jgi:uncharacterized protein YecE (DUF72 family)
MLARLPREQKNARAADFSRAYPVGVAIRLGTSGYSYAHWKRLFYEGVPAPEWLAHYARVFRTVELNNTFYRLPTPEMVDGWYRSTPAEFLFACKGSRFLTHMKRLLDEGEGIRKYFALVNRLGKKLGPVLWQLPPQMNKADPGRLEAFIERLPAKTPHAFEFRSEAWYTRDVTRVLDRRGAAFCEHDLVQRRPPELTGGWRYLRFHGAEAKYAGRYGKEGLASHVRELMEWGERSDGDAFAYFNNDAHGHALMDALDWSELMGDPVPLELHGP